MNMLQVSSAIRLLGEALKTNGSRTLHNAAVAKNLQNTESMVGVLADSTGRTKNKLLAENEEKIGPCTDLLKHVSRPDDWSVQEEPKEVIGDPNISMWTMYKDIEEPKVAAKKLKTKFKKLKDSIKNYYVDRLEETEELLNQVDKPFVIGKLGKESRKSKTMRPVELAMLKMTKQKQVSKSNNGGYKEFHRSNYSNKLKPEVKPCQESESINPKSLETLGDSNPDQVNGNGGVTETANGLPSLNHSKNHNLFNNFSIPSYLHSQMFSTSAIKLKSERNFQSVIQKNIFQRVKTQITGDAKSLSTSAACNNSTCPRTLTPKSLICDPDVKLPKCPKPESHQWACCPKITLCGCDPPHPRSQLKNCGRDDKIPEFPYSKNPQYICPAFSECLRNTELIQERPHECCMKKKPCDVFVGVQKQFLTALERQELSLGQNYWTGSKEQKREFHTSVVNRSVRTDLLRRTKESLPSQANLFSTCVAKNETSTRTMPSKNMVCDPENKLPKCPKPEGFKWPCCPKITLCGCDPPHPRSQLPNCGRDELIPEFPYSKNPQYICPSFSECKRNTQLKEEKTQECCIKKKVCGNIVGVQKPFITALERQEMSLGQKYWTGNKVQKCDYHTTARRMDKEGCTSCNKASCETCFEPAEGFCCPKKKKDQTAEDQLCMKINCIPGKRKKEKFETFSSLDECEKICLPCCEPSKEPPVCDRVNYQTETCKKKRNPSPSYSECHKKEIVSTNVCECLIKFKPKCKNVDTPP